jgi:hypothetical protein
VCLANSPAQLWSGGADTINSSSHREKAPAELPGNVTKSEGRTPSGINRALGPAAPRAMCCRRPWLSPTYRPRLRVVVPRGLACVTVLASRWQRKHYARANHSWRRWPDELLRFICSRTGHCVVLLRHLMLSSAHPPG